MHKMSVRAALSASLLLVAAVPVALGAPSELHTGIFPPWQNGQNNDTIDRGLDFTVPQIDDLADFHGDISNPKLVLYVGGNYYFAMASLVAEFEESLCSR